MFHLRRRQKSLSVRYEIVNITCISNSGNDRICGVSEIKMTIKLFCSCSNEVIDVWSTQDFCHECREKIDNSQIEGYETCPGVWCLRGKSR